MLYLLLADLVLIIHLGFILFVTLGGLFLVRRRWLVYLHLPAAVWGASIELRGGICPLTPLEQYLRRAGGDAGYAGGFIEHYLTAAIYPHGLTKEMQIALGILVLLLNALFYRRWWLASRRPPAHAADSDDQSAQARKRSV